MGRKKRKSVEEPAGEQSVPAPVAPPPMDPRRAAKASLPQPPVTSTPVVVDNVKDETMNLGDDMGMANDDNKQPLKSGYAMTTHSAEIVDEDIYVSDGSDDDDEDPEEVALRDVEMVLAGSRMGIMRRGIHHPMLVQPNRRWAKKDAQSSSDAAGDGDGEGGDGEDADAEQKRLQQEEEELAKLDPAQRAARLLAEKQRKLEEAKESARRLESEENAGRDPCLFSKRTAFDIRFDQIDDKPWTRGGDFTDFFNYGLTEEDWLEYSQQQLMIRQELTDANRQRRAADPTVVPVTPRAPSKQTPKVAVSVKTDGTDDIVDSIEGSSKNTPLGPVLVKKEGSDSNTDASNKNKGGQGLEILDDRVYCQPVSSGGAWGAGAAAGSMLAKLIEEQERKEDESKYGPSGVHQDDSRGNGNREGEHDFNHGGDDYGSSRPGGHPSSQDKQKNHYGGGASHYGGGGGQHWDQYGGGGGHRSGGRGGGGRGYYGGRGGGGGGRGGRGGYRDRHHGRGGYSDGGDYHRKRPRDDYGDSRGGWRR